MRRQARGQPLTLPVTVLAIRPNEMLTQSVGASVRLIPHDGAQIGYVRLWSFTSDEVRTAVTEALTGPLANADALVLDLRSRWGGAPPDAAEYFVGGAPAMRMIMRDGAVLQGNVRWKKPVVAIIDGGTRSGLEVLAYALKKNGVPLVGERTAGAVLGGTVFVLPDDSLLLLAGADAIVDERRLEGVGIEPDVKVGFPLPFANGADPQMEAALDLAARPRRAASSGRPGRR